MPRTRTDLARDDRIAGIVDAARDLFTEHGYGGTTMAEVARRAGVANNTVYWYFPSKDALFCAVVEREALEGFGLLATRSNETIASNIRWILDRLEFRKDWLTAIHERASDSPEIAALHERLHEISDALVRSGLTQKGLDQREASLTVAAIGYMLEGMLMHGGAEDSRDDLVDFVVERFFEPDQSQ